MADDIFIQAKLLKPIHMLCIDKDESDNHYDAIHIFEEVALVTNGKALVVYNLYELMAQKGKDDAYKLLVGFAIPRTVWDEMVKYPWLVFYDEDGTHIQIEKKGSSLIYTCDLAASNNVFDIYQKFKGSFVKFKPVEFNFFYSSFLQKVSKVLTNVCLTSRAGQHTIVDEDSGKEDTFNTYLHQFTESYNPYLAIYILYNPSNADDYNVNQLLS